MTLVRRNAGANHYYLDVADDGTETKVPGVTSILSDSIPKSGLVNWAAREAAGYAVEHWAELAGEKMLRRADLIATAWRAERDAAAGRGQLIHRLAEKLQRGEPVEKPAGLEGHIEACVRFLDDYDVAPIVAETAVVNRSVVYAGTLDLVCDMLGQRWLLDWKTGRDVYAETALQLAAYARAEHYLDADKAERPMAELLIDRAAVVHLRGDSYEVYPMAITEQAFTLFRHCAYVARWLKRTQDERGQWSSRLDTFKGPALQPGSATPPAELTTVRGNR